MGELLLKNVVYIEQKTNKHKVEKESEPAKSFERDTQSTQRVFSNSSSLLNINIITQNQHLSYKQPQNLSNVSKQCQQSQFYMTKPSKQDFPMTKLSKQDFPMTKSSNQNMPMTKPSKQDFSMMKSTQTQDLDTTLKQCNKQLQNLSITKPFQLQDIHIKSKQNNQFAISSLQTSSSKLSSFKQCIIPQFQQCYTPQFKQDLYIPQ